MTQNADLTPEWVLGHLDALMRRAADGDLDAAADAHRVFSAFVDYLGSGGHLPAHWAPAATETTLNSSTAVLAADENGNWYLTVDQIAPATDPAPVVLFETEDQYGFNFGEPDPAPAAVRQVTYYPKPTKSAPGTPRTTSAANTPIPIDAPSLLGAGMPFAGFNNPTESHEAIHEGSQAWRSMKRHEMFWLIHDAPDGMCDFEMEEILGEHHGRVSGRRNGLMNDGYVVRSGRRRLTPLGKPANVWVPTEWAKTRVRLGYEKRPGSR